MTLSTNDFRRIHRDLSLLDRGNAEHVAKHGVSPPEAEYVVVPDAGHSIREPGIVVELVAAVKRMQQRLSGETAIPSGRVR